MEKKGIKFDKDKIISRKKTQIEKIIEEDDIENLKLLLNSNLDFNQRIEKENQLYEYRDIPILLFCIEKSSLKCFKFLLINGANPLEEASGIQKSMITSVSRIFGAFREIVEEPITGMTLAVEKADIRMIKIIEENKGEINKDVFNGAGKFHQNKLLKTLYLKALETYQKNQHSNKERKKEKDCYGLCSCARYNNFEGVLLLLEIGVDVNSYNHNQKTIKKDWSSLHYAAENGLLRMVDLLLSKGADINAKDIIF